MKAVKSNVSLAIIVCNCPQKFETNRYFCVPTFFTGQKAEEKVTLRS